MKADSSMKVRKARTDSMTAMRKKVTDSLAKTRKAKSDSLAGIRKARTDSLAGIKKLKADSVAQKKDKRAKDQKTREKDKENKQQLAFELKLKKKRSAYSNEKMLKKSWSAPRQLIQNTFTRYNYYFNADRKMDEALENMQRVRKDNYDSLLALFPFNPDRDSSLLSGDMDSIIQKASVGIQIHDPRTKWGDDLYLLLGQAYFYKGKYSEASASFRYILSLRDKRKKKKSGSSSSYTASKSKTAPSIVQKDKKGMLDFMLHRSVHNEAILWLARTFTQMKQEGNAESVLDLVATDPNFPEDLKGRLALEKANIYLAEKDMGAASKQLDIVAKDKNMPNWMRMRAGYMNGQIQQSRNDYVAAAASFKDVTELNPKIDMDFYARKNMAYSLMLAGGDQKEATASLKKVLNDGKYSPYYEQIYYVLGRLAANSGNDDDAINYLKQGLQSVKATGRQKAQSFATLGGIYYKRGEYIDAKKAYDSAALLAASGPADSLILVAMKRSTVLGSITGPATIIRSQDSLLGLASLSEREQRSEIRQYIRSLERARSDSAIAAESASMNKAMEASAASVNSGNPYANWYFANPMLMQQGQNEFKRKWGNRPLADNWRRTSAGFGNSAANNNNNGAAPDEPEEAELDENGLPTEASLYAFIPNTPEQKQGALMNIERAYVDLSGAYIRELEDYPPAIRAMDTFDKRFPNTDYKAEVLYLRYLAAMRQNKLNDAQTYAGQILQQYADTKWAALVRPSESGAGMNNADRNEGIAAYHDETYDLLIQRDYTGALARSRQALRQFTDANYGKRFRIMEGIALTGLASYDTAEVILQGFIKEYPTDSLKPWAEATLQYIQKNKPPPPPPPAIAAARDSSGRISTGPPTSGPNAVEPPKPAENAAAANTTGTPPPAAPSSVPPPPPPPAANPAAAPAAYTYNTGEEHYVMFAFGPMEPRAAGVKAAISDFNKFKFSNMSLNTTSESLKVDQGIIITRSFKNVAEAKIYMNMLRATTQVFREYKPTEYQLVLISAKNYLKMVADKDVKPYMQFYNTKYK